MNDLSYTNLQQLLFTFSQKFLRYNFISVKSKLTQFPLMICLFTFTLIFSHNIQAQTYSGTETFMDGGTTYSFDYTIECSGDGTSALVTTTYTTAIPPGLVPQLNLGGGMFVTMSGSNPYSHNITGLTSCEFDFQFWMAYTGGGLYTTSSLNPAVLPIELSSFSVTKHGENNAKLDWRTLTEINSDYFGVQRSFDGIIWENIHKIKAAGNSNTDLSYSYLDTDLSLSSKRTIIYYKLKLIDLDGTFEYSDVLSIEFDNNNVVSIYPNPTSERLNVDLTDFNISTGTVQLRLYNNSGSVVMVKEVNENSTESLDLTTLPAATYSIIVTQGKEIIYRNNIIKVN